MMSTSLPDPDCRKVSIVLPTHNGAALIRESIDSCLSQTHSNLELIVVDDGSTDSTLEVLDSYEDSRLTIVKNDVNEGLPRALNRGFSVASGDFLTWTSDDNSYAPQAIEKMLRCMAEKKVEFVFADFYRVTESEGRETQKTRVSLSDLPIFMGGNPIGACFLYDRRIMEEVGSYDPEAYLAEDLDYWIRVSKRFAMGHLSEPLYLYRDRPGALSSRRQAVRIANMLVMLKNQIIDPERASMRYVREIVVPIWLHRHKLPEITSFLERFRILSLLLGIRYRKTPAPIFSKFYSGSISFESARTQLMMLNESIS